MRDPKLLWKDYQGEKLPQSERYCICGSQYMDKNKSKLDDNYPKRCSWCEGKRMHKQIGSCPKCGAAVYTYTEWDIAMPAPLINTCKCPLDYAVEMHDPVDGTGKFHSVIPLESSGIEAEYVHIKSTTETT